MSRPRIHNKHLPRGMYYRHGAYYLVRGQKWVRVGTTLQAALTAYAAVHEGRTERTVSKPNRPQQVYVIGARRLIKIGVASDLAARVRMLRTGNPDIERVLYATEPMSNARLVESEAHRELTAHRVEGEWFRCARQLAIDTVKRFEKSLQIGQLLDKAK